jgi:hypothetical protein
LFIIPSRCGNSRGPVARHPKSVHPVAPWCLLRI